MSHDLKSPLTSIRAYTEALLEGVAKDEAAKQRYLQTIHAKEADMEAMVNWLFEFAKMDASTCPVRSEPLFLRQTMEELTGEWNGADVSVTPEIPDDLRVLADRELLSRITANLIGNSRKYSGREVVHIAVSAEASGDMAEIRFSDDGAGVPPEQLPKLFDAFYRGDAARTAPGSGSGLSLSRQIGDVAALARQEQVRTGGEEEHGDREELWKSQITPLSAVNYAVLGGTAILWLALVTYYWLLVMAWLYENAVNEGMNKSLWPILGLFTNLLAVFAFLIVRDNPRRVKPQTVE